MVRGARWLRSCPLPEAGRQLVLPAAQLAGALPRSCFARGEGFCKRCCWFHGSGHAGWPAALCFAGGNTDALMFLFLHPPPPAVFGAPVHRACSARSATRCCCQEALVRPQALPRLLPGAGFSLPTRASSPTSWSRKFCARVCGVADGHAHIPRMPHPTPTCIMNASPRSLLRPCSFTTRACALTGTPASGLPCRALDHTFCALVTDLLAPAHAFDPQRPPAPILPAQPSPVMHAMGSRCAGTAPPEQHPRLPSPICGVSW